MALVDYGTLPPIPARDANGRLVATRVGKVIDSTLRTFADLQAAGVFVAAGTALPGYPTLVLTEVRVEFPERGDSSPRLIESYVEATGTLTQVGRDELTADQDGRRRLSRLFIQLASAGYAQGTIGSTTTSGSVNLVLETEKKTESEAVRRVQRNYIEATETIAEIGYPTYSRGEDDRKTIRRLFIIKPLADGAEPAGLQGVIGIEVFDGCVCSQAQADQNLARVLVSKTYIEATDSPAQIGDVGIRDLGDAGAFTGTAGNYKPARAYSYSYLIKGDAPNESLWLTLNTQLGATGRYYTGGGMVIRGKSYTVVQREYTEMPATYGYHVSDRYPFPGVVALRSDGVPYVSQMPTTRVTAIRVEETYHLGEPTTTALGYDPQRWTSGTVKYVPSDNNPSNLDGYDDYDFPHCLGSVGTTALNKYYKGIKCSSVFSSFSSVPSAKPTGEQCISSVPRRWRGQIWRRTNQYVTF